MKKLFCLLLINFTLFSNDRLSNAILKCDYKIVNVILENVSLTPQEKIAYLDLIDNVIDSKRKNTEFDWIKQFVSKKIIFGTLLSLIAFRDLQIASNKEALKKINPQLFNQIVGNENIENSITLLFISVITGLIMFIYGIYDGHCYITSLHDDLEAAEMIKFAILNH